MANKVVEEDPTKYFVVDLDYTLDNPSESAVTYSVINGYELPNTASETRASRTTNGASYRPPLERSTETTDDTSKQVNMYVFDANAKKGIREVLTGASYESKPDLQVRLGGISGRGDLEVLLADHKKGNLHDRKRENKRDNKGYERGYLNYWDGQQERAKRNYENRNAPEPPRSDIRILPRDSVDPYIQHFFTGRVEDELVSNSSDGKDIPGNERNSRVVRQNPRNKPGLLAMSSHAIKKAYEGAANLKYMQQKKPA